MTQHRQPTTHTFGVSPREGAAPPTSSAFSASAQPNEDWTKISDLAERRRIQNRIAQRNYRKKLKKRLEDLERRASSTSASPEPTPVEAPSKVQKTKSKASPSKRRSSSTTVIHAAVPAPPAAQLPLGDWQMFSEQFPRQISNSPPPFTLPTFPAPLSPPLPSDGFPYASDLSIDGSFTVPASMQPYDSASLFNWQDKPMPIKQDNSFEGDMGCFNMVNYAPFGVDMTFPSISDSSFSEASFHEPSLTPELCDLYEQSSAGSPGDITHALPQTPNMMPLSPQFSAPFAL